MQLHLVSWNIARSPEAWRRLSEMDADVGLVQEAVEPPNDARPMGLVRPSDEWRLAGWEDRASCTAIAQLSDRVAVEPIPVAPLAVATNDQIAVSRPGSLTAAVVTVGAAAPITVVSVYAAWERPLGYPSGGWIYADANAHRLISDISQLVATMTRHRIIVAGDFNLLRGYGEHKDEYWRRRYDTVFERFDAIGLRFVGPDKDYGLQADPWPEELPPDSRNVPTYRRHRLDPATATRQLDFVFASESLGESVTASALNAADDWGPSDHCRIAIDVEI